MTAHIVWHWNGTLLDDFDICVEAADHACRRAAGIPVDSNLYRRHYTRPVRTFYDRIFGRQVSDSEWRLIADDYHRHYAALAESAKLHTEAREVLNWVVGQGITQSLLSMAGHQDLMALLARHRLDRPFLLVTGSRGEDRTASKRNALATHLNTVAQHRGEPLEPNSVLMIGDTLDDAEAAASVGAKCVLLADGHYDSNAQAELGFGIATGLRAAVDIGLRSTGGAERRCRSEFSADGLECLGGG